jgi:CubicO group peptidase (beta-lactamase class C family)
MKKRFIVLPFLCVFIIGFSSFVLAQALPTAVPEEVGLSSERLERIDRYIQNQIDKKELSGAVVLVARKGKVAYKKAIGLADIEKKKPMKTDTIFRLCSSSKMISAVAGMILWEDGLFDLFDPVSKYIPELKDTKVIEYNPKDPTKYKIVPAKSPMLVYHAFNFTAGLTYSSFFGGAPLTKMLADDGLNNGFWPNDYDLAEYFKRRAKHPFLNHPGEQWNYGMDLQIVARIVEVQTGMSFGDFCRERIFKPLGMKDTHYFLPDEKLPRLVTLYLRSEKGLETTAAGEIINRPELAILEDTDPFWFVASKSPGKYFGAGEGLLSTIEDYANFLQMMLNGGELNGVRILSRKTIEFMTVDHVPGIACCKQFFGPAMEGHGWGLGLAVLNDQGGGSIGSPGKKGRPGQYRWGGWMGTVNLVDPKEDMFMLLMTQQLPNNPVVTKFKDLVYQAIVD